MEDSYTSLPLSTTGAKSASGQAGHTREAMENGSSTRRTCSDRAVAVATVPVLVHQVAGKQRLRPYRL